MSDPIDPWRLDDEKLRKLTSGESTMPGDPMFNAGRRRYGNDLQAVSKTLPNFGSLVLNATEEFIGHLGDVELVEVVISFHKEASLLTPNVEIPEIPTVATPRHYCLWFQRYGYMSDVPQRPGDNIAGWNAGWGEFDHNTGTQGSDALNEWPSILAPDHDIELVAQGCSYVGFFQSGYINVCPKVGGSVESSWTIGGGGVSNDFVTYAEGSRLQILSEPGLPLTVTTVGGGGNGSVILTQYWQEIMPAARGRGQLRRRNL